MTVHIHTIVSSSCTAVLCIVCMQVPVEAVLLLLMMVDLQSMVSNNNDEYWCLYNVLVHLIDVHVILYCNMSL